MNADSEEDSEKDPNNSKRKKGNNNRSRSRRRCRKDISPKVDYLEKTVVELLSNIENIEVLMENAMKSKLDKVLEDISSKITAMVTDTLAAKIPEFMSSIPSCTSSVNIDPEKCSSNTASNFPKVSKNQSNSKVNLNNNVYVNGNLEDNTIMTNVENFPSLSVKKKKVASKPKGESVIVCVDTKYKAKPIIGQCINQKILREKLLEKNMNNYKIFKTKDPNKSVIIPNNKEVRDATIQILSEDKINFFTYTPDEEKCSTLIIKGVSSDYDLSDVEAEFRRLSLTDKIQGISTMKEKKLERFNFFVLRLKPGVTVGEFLAIKYFLNSTITIEKLNRTSALQCFKCQGLDHVATNCNMNPRCVKCAEEHLSENCQIARNSPSDSLKCALCGQKGHPASYRGCPEMVKMIKQRNSKKSSKEAPNVRPNSGTGPIITSYVKENVSFASAFTGQSAKGSNIGGIKTILNKASLELFGCEYSTLKNAFDCFMTTYIGMSDESVKKEALMDFMLNTNYHEYV